MEHFVKVICVVAVIGLWHICCGQEIGQVYIGSLGPGFTNTTTYSFNLNEGRQQLPIYLRITDLSNPSVDLPLRDSVDISCEVSVTGAGYTAVNFQPLNFPPSAPPLSGTIAFDLNSAGRSVDVRCYGVSAGFTCPANLTGLPGLPQQPQFCRDSSISQPVSLTVRPAPIVSFCDSVIVVPNDGETQGTLTLKLSEPVETNPVNIYCSIVSSTGLDLAIVPPAPIQNGNNSVTVTYNILGRGGPSTVAQCVANSQAGNQFLNTTSSGATSQTQFLLSTGRIQLLPRITPAYSTFFQGVLMLDAGATRDDGISFRCGATVVADMTQALDLVQNPSCDFSVNITTPATTTAPTTIDYTSAWILDEASFAFQQDQTYKTVTARRERVVLAEATELVVMTCCVMSSTDKYTNMSMAMLAANYITPYYCANCTGGPTSGTAGSERVIQNPGFQEVAPCPCDLTYSVCDTHCCCDQECTEGQKQTFSYCIPGPFGGQGYPTPLRNCQSNHTLKDDWFPLMCVQFETNAYLGLFYENTVALKTEIDFSVKLAQQPSFYSYRENEDRYFDPDATSIGYKDGLNVRTERKDVTLTSYPTQGVLALPSTSGGAGCLNVASVRFLRDRTSECVHSNFENKCVASSVLSATMYAESTTKSHPPCPEAYRILEQYGGSNVRIADTYVSYYCAPDDSNYVKSSQSISDVINSTVSQTFPQELFTENCTIPCDDPACLLYNENQEQTTPLPPRCTWDDGFTQPPIPVVNGALCENSVVDVRYLFTWTGAKIVNLNATIILAPARHTIGGSPTSVGQSFDVKFQHMMDSPGNATDNYNNDTGIFERSGKPGYDFGKPLVSGCSGVDFVDRNTSRQMAIFNTAPDGLCYSATRRYINFGEDVFSTCKLRLNINTINNCTSLRQLLLNHLSVLMPADVIGRKGYNDPRDPNMWVSVLRDTPYFNTTETDNSTGDSFYQPIDNVRGICYNVTTGVNLVVLYGEAGKTNGYPIREVVGARVSYTVSDMQMSCVGANSVRCDSNSQYVQTFLLTSSVSYIKVPASTPQQQIRFYSSKDPSCTSDSCARYYEDFDQSICHFDSCWSEIFYPLTQSYGADPPMYTLAISLVAVLFVIAYFMITRPWF